MEGELMSSISREPSSFRDPSGFMFKKNNEFYRQVNFYYKDDYDRLMNSGLYEELVRNSLLVPHEEVNLLEAPEPDTAYKVIKPKKIPFISYAYEWSFEQLKDAALLTLKIQKLALEYGMSLKDGSSYNVQFHEGKPIFIDTLSFEKYEEGKPWVAYRQFCQHFYAPLVLMSKYDIRMNQLFRIYIDGIPLDLASKMLPWSTRLNFSILSHIHLHAKSQMKYSNKQDVSTGTIFISKQRLTALIDHLESSIRNLKWQQTNTEWGDYYQKTNYSDKGMKHKEQIVSDYIDRVQAKNVWDLGANIGHFSRIAGNRGISTISFDIDPAAVNQNYLLVKKNQERNLLPLLLDLTNPSSNIGWANEERKSFVERGPTDLIMALALIHHLVISNNVPIRSVAAFLSKLCRYLIIEFVPLHDSQVQKLLVSRKNIFDDYTQDHFEKQFGEYFDILDSQTVADSVRTIYLMRSKIGL